MPSVVRGMRGRDQSRVRREPSSRRVSGMMVVQLRVVVMEGSHAVDTSSSAVHARTVTAGAGVHAAGVYAAHSHRLQSQRI